ncbi:MAG: hypothetical protein AAF715_22710 [Myxococcota bacterium]
MSVNRGLGASLGLLWFAGLSGPGCSLSNPAITECGDDAACAVAFGFGSRCREGFCSMPATCETGYDCRVLLGGGVCVDGACRDELPADPLGACRRLEPESLAAQSLVGPDAPLLMGAMFGLDDASDVGLLDAAVLAVAEINEGSGIVDGRPLGFVGCDVGGPRNGLAGAEREAQIRVVVDHLAGTLGVPLIVGPVTSDDALDAVSHALSQRYPVAFVSPAATSAQLTTAPDRLDAEDLFGLFWRTAPSDALQGEVLARQVVGALPSPMPLGRVAVVFLDDAYGRGLADVFEGSFGPDRIDRFSFAVDVDFDQLATQVAASAPDAVVLITPDARDVISFIREAVALPALLDKTLYVTDAARDEAVLLDDALEAEVVDVLLARVVGTAPAAPRGPLYDTFAANYASRFGSDPGGFPFAGHAYDAAYIGAAGIVYGAATVGAPDGRHVASGLARLIIGASVSVGSMNWDAVKEALTGGARSVDLQGVSGTLAFDPVIGEAPSLFDVWRPSDNGCADGATRCFETIAELAP